MAPSSLALHGVLQDGYEIYVVPGDVAKPGEIASFHHCSKGLLLFSKGVHLLSHVFVSVVLSVTRSLMKHLFFKSLDYSLCFCCQSSTFTSIEEQ